MKIAPQRQKKYEFQVFEVLLAFVYNSKFCSEAWKGGDMNHFKPDVTEYVENPSLLVFYPWTILGKPLFFRNP